MLAQDSRGEVQRLIDTFKIAAEEATRMYGEPLQPWVSMPCLTTCCKGARMLQDPYGL